MTHRAFTSLTAIVLVGVLCGVSAAAEIAIFTETTAGDVLPDGGTALTHSFDTTFRSDIAGVSLSGEDTVNLPAGHYLAIYNSQFTSSNNTNNERRQIQSNLNLGGSALSVGWSSGYIRQDTTEGNQTAVTTGASIFNVAAGGQTLQFESYRTDNSPNAGSPVANAVTRDASRTGLQLLKLDDTAGCLRLTGASGQAGPTGHGVANRKSVTYGTPDETSAVFGFTGTGASPESNITLNSGGKYLVVANTYGDIGSNTRTTLQQRLALNGSAVTGSTTTVYLRGTDSTNEGAVALGTIIEANAGDTLNVEIFLGEGAGDTGSTIDGAKTGLSIVKLGSAARTISLTEVSGTPGTGQNINNGDPVDWTTSAAADTPPFSFDAGTSAQEVTVTQPGDYLFLASFYSEDNAPSRGFPASNFETLAPDDTETEYDFGRSGFYTRGGQSGGDQSGNFNSAMLDLDTSDRVRLQTEALGNSGSTPLDIGALQGLELASAFKDGIMTQTGWTEVKAAWASADDANFFGVLTDVGDPDDGIGTLGTAGSVNADTDGGDTDNSGNDTVGWAVGDYVLEGNVTSQLAVDDVLAVMDLTIPEGATDIDLTLTFTQDMEGTLEAGDALLFEIYDVVGETVLGSLTLEGQSGDNSFSVGDSLEALTVLDQVGLTEVQARLIYAGDGWNGDQEEIQIGSPVFTATYVPEPATMALAAVGLLGMARRRKACR